jgi:NAD(P)-dependent dehydrogenase (short-subunit alcohol dehydrogenase family)
MTVRDRVAVVTGSASGIGSATIDALVDDGFRVAGIDLEPGEAQREVLTVGADVSAAAEVDAALARIHAELGPVDVLVNNAGTTGGPAATTCHETSPEDWDRVLAVNVRGPFLCTRAALPSMLSRGSGHIVNVASVAGLVAFPGRCAYTASKGAVVAFTRSLAADYAAAGIRANAVCPGMVETPMTQWRLDSPPMRAEIESRIPLGRVARPEEIAGAIAVLITDRLSYMTGQTLVLDGGWTTV